MKKMRIKTSSRSTLKYLILSWAKTWIIIIFFLLQENPKKSNKKLHFKNWTLIKEQEQTLHLHQRWPDNQYKKVSQQIIPEDQISECKQDENMKWMTTSNPDKHFVGPITQHCQAAELTDSGNNYSCRALW